MVGKSCPTATELLTLVRALQEQPVPTYLCTWMAFDSIARLIARQSGVKPHFELRKNGTMKLLEVGDIKIPKVTAASNSLMFEAVVDALDPAVKHAVLVHRSVLFFATRTPTFHGKVVKTDRRGHLLNGMIDLSRTMDARYPIWSPITMRWYETYVGEPSDGFLQQKLMAQVIDLLAVLRENLLYADGKNDQECGKHLVSNAQPLLDMLINGLTV
ncbi:MAG: hypothetical protein P1S60_12990 [Anaerolineae bacterium]|nr:hypothetical protein [Anaerolineae bacterium]